MSDLETEFCRLPDVIAVRVVTNPDAEPVEVHVLARTGKPAKQIVRDIQSVALTSFGLDLDRRIVSVVQLSANGARTTGSAPGETIERIQLAALECRTAARRTTFRITLAQGDEETIGTSEGSAANGVRARLVAAATLDALRQLDASAAGFDVDAAGVNRLGTEDVATVTLLAFEHDVERRLVGSAIVVQHVDDAVARAVLDATNRRLARSGPDH